MHKVLITDVDGPLGNCNRIADIYGVREIYDVCKKDPSVLQEKLKGFGPEINEMKYNFVKSFELNSGVKQTLMKLKKRDYDNFGSTDNLIFDRPQNVEVFMKKFYSNGKCCLDGIHCSKLSYIKDGKVKIENNGSKEYFAEKLFRAYGKGIYIVDDKNDIEPTKHVRNLRNELNLELNIIKVGHNCKELEKFSDYSVDGFPEILNYV